MFTRHSPTRFSAAIPSNIAVPLIRLPAIVTIELAMPSASCLIVPTIEPLLIAYCAAEVASTPNTGMAVPPEVL